MGWGVGRVVGVTASSFPWLYTVLMVMISIHFKYKQMIFESGKGDMHWFEK